MIAGGASLSSLHMFNARSVNQRKGEQSARLVSHSFEQTRIVRRSGMNPWTQGRLVKDLRKANCLKVRANLNSKGGVARRMVYAVKFEPSLVVSESPCYVAHSVDMSIASQVACVLGTPGHPN